MSNRFNNWDFGNEDEDMREEEGSDEETEEKEIENALKQELMSVQFDQIDILQQDVDEKIMQDAIAIASKDWLWMFRKSSTKMKIIKKIYIQLKNIMEN